MELRYGFGRYGEVYQVHENRETLIAELISYYGPSEPVDEVVRVTCIDRFGNSEVTSYNLRQKALVSRRLTLD
jgi:hypothetical protein